MANKIQQSTLKYKIVGIINIVLGVFNLILLTIMVLFVMPQMYQLYDSVNAQLNPLQQILPFVLGFSYAFLLIFIGNRLLSKTVMNKEKFFKISLVLIIIYLFLIPIISIIGVINPIYSLLSAFE